MYCRGRRRLLCVGRASWWARQRRRRSHRPPRSLSGTSHPGPGPTSIPLAPSPVLGRRTVYVGRGGSRSIFLVPGITVLLVTQVPRVHSPSMGGVLRSSFLSCLDTTLKKGRRLVPRRPADGGWTDPFSVESTFGPLLRDTVGRERVTEADRGRVVVSPAPLVLPDQTGLQGKSL